jgi:peroxiredoxin
MRRIVGTSVLALVVGLGTTLAETPPEGKPAPAFEVTATSIDKALPDKKDAKTISLKDFEGKKNVVLFFFPKAGTKG